MPRTDYAPTIPSTCASLIVELLFDEIMLNLNTALFLKLCLLSATLKNAAYSRLRRPLMLAQAAWVKAHLTNVPASGRYHNSFALEAANPYVDLDPILMAKLTDYEETTIITFMKKWSERIDQGLTDVDITARSKRSFLCKATHGRLLRTPKGEDRCWLMKNVFFARLDEAAAQGHQRTARCKYAALMVGATGNVMVCLAAKTKKYMNGCSFQQGGDQRYHDSIYYGASGDGQPLQIAPCNWKLVTLHRDLGWWHRAATVERSRVQQKWRLSEYIHRHFILHLSFVEPGFMKRLMSEALGIDDASRTRLLETIQGIKDQRLEYGHASRQNGGTIGSFNRNSSSGP
ncbi:hypothetical protein HDU87_007790 [Geranomyces variabilis]|uniref:Uncharacterized protein n=1 Tax=Geranomyces variabilis TaxID=109894 RepID=A0AAD5TJ48_9FUNG|nr:hypothetical protein HDU87_007790 [Geranomyces variabilis]